MFSRPGCSPRTPRATGFTSAPGFRVVGIRERVGCHDGWWRDVVFIERRSSTVS